MEEVRGAGGPWTVAGDPQEGGEGGGCWWWSVRGLVLAGGGKMDTNGQMEGQR